MQNKGKSQSSAFTPSLLPSRISKSSAISTKPVKFNTPNSSGSKSARMDSSSQPSTQGTQRSTRVQTDLVREAQQIPLKTVIDMKDKDEKRKGRFKRPRPEYGATNNSGSSLFTYNAPDMFTEYNRRKPADFQYENKDSTTTTKDLFANISTISLVPNFPIDTDDDIEKSKRESALWLSFSEVFNNIRSHAYKNKKNDSFTVLTRRTVWDYWTVLSQAVSLYATLTNLIQGAALYPGNWSMEEISLTLNSDADLLRWIDVLGQVIDDRVLPSQYTKAIIWHSTPKYAYDCPNSAIIMAMHSADMIPITSSSTWTSTDNFTNSIKNDIIALVDDIRADDTHNRVDNLLRTICTDRIDIRDMAKVSNKADPAFTEMFANDVVRLKDSTGIETFPVLADANNDRRVSYYIAGSAKSPTFGAYFTTAISSDQPGNAANGQSVTWLRRMQYLSPSESGGNNRFETNVWVGEVDYSGQFTDFIWKPRNGPTRNFNSPSCHIMTEFPDSTENNTKFISTNRIGMQAVDYFTPDFQYNTFSDFTKWLLSVNLVDKVS